MTRKGSVGNWGTKGAGRASGVEEQQDLGLGGR